MHFDAYANFVFQIAGSKTWYLNEVDGFNNPTRHFELDDPFGIQEGDGVSGKIDENEIGLPPRGAPTVLLVRRFHGSGVHAATSI